MLFASWSIDRIVSPGNPSGLLSSTNTVTDVSVYNFRNAQNIMIFNRNARSIEHSDSIYALQFTDNVLEFYKPYPDSLNFFLSLNFNSKITDFKLAGNIAIVNTAFKTGFYRIGNSAVDTLYYNDYLGEIDRAVLDDSMLYIVSRANCLNMMKIINDSVIAVDLAYSPEIRAMFINDFGYLCIYTKNYYFDFYNVSSGTLLKRGSIYDIRDYEYINKTDSLYYMSNENTLYSCENTDSLQFTVRDSIILYDCVREASIFNDTLFVMTCGNIYRIDNDFNLIGSSPVSYQVCGAGLSVQGFNILSGNDVLGYFPDGDSLSVKLIDIRPYDIKDNVILCSDSSLYIDIDSLLRFDLGNIPGAVHAVNDTFVYSTLTGDMRVCETGTDRFLFSTVYPVYDMEFSTHYTVCSGFDGMAVVDTNGNVSIKRHFDAFMSRVFASDTCLTAVSQNGEVYFTDSVLNVNSSTSIGDVNNFYKTDSCLYALTVDSIYMINDRVDIFDFSQGLYSDAEHFACGDSTAVLVLKNNVIMLLKAGPTMIRENPKSHNEPGLNIPETFMFDLTGRRIKNADRSGIYFISDGNAIRKLYKIK